jgi:hypothetical protein
MNIEIIFQMIMLSNRKTSVRVTRYMNSMEVIQNNYFYCMHPVVYLLVNSISRLVNTTNFLIKYEPIKPHAGGHKKPQR